MSKKYKVITPTADVREVPDNTAHRGKMESQLLYGEVFIAEEEKDGWIKGTCEHDGYPGYVEKTNLTSAFSAATHIVTAARSDVYADDTIKSPLQKTLSMGSRLTIVEETEKFSKLDTGEWIYSAHISPLPVQESDFVSVAEKLAETPYVWAGRGGLGVDCSGLVQLSLAFIGVAAPRDTGDQEKVIGVDVSNEPRKRGDIVYFPGHVGIMVDDTNMLHANATHMKVTIEPLVDAAARSDNKITAVRRIK